MSYSQPRRGRPPTRDWDKMVEYYGGVKQIPESAVAAFMASQDPLGRAIARTLPRSNPVTPITIVRPESNETDDQIIERIKHRFQIIQDFTHLALSGDLTSMLVSGAPGVGKSHNIKRILRHGRDNDGALVEFVTGGNITPINLYKALYRMRHNKSVLLLDDADAVWDDEASLSVLKGALDSVRERQISWLSESAALKSEDIPQTFMFSGACIFISNKDIQNDLDMKSTRLTPHIGAVVDRTQYIDLQLHTARELSLWVEHIVLSTHMLVAEGLTRDQERDVIQFVKEHRDKMRRGVSLRSAMKCVPYIKRYGNGWKAVARMTLLR